MIENQSEAALPLAGIVVVDLTRALAGPYATLLLAELGARVIKVESPKGGDDARAFPPFVGGRSVYFASINRDKESIALDLKAADDRAVFDRLLATADVLVENYRPGVMARLGYAWDDVRARWPRLVMASISGFGQTGPYAGRTAYDMVAQAMGGIMSITGQEPVGGEAGQPARVGVSIGDIAAGLFATVGILGALQGRAKTGAGAQVDISMLDCQAALLENAIARHLATGEMPGPMGARHPTITPFGVFRAADGYLAICVGTEAQFAALAAAIGQPGLPDDPRFATMAARNRHAAALQAALEACLAAAGRAHWLAALEGVGVPCGPLNTVADLVNDPQIRSRDMLLTVEDEAGPMTLAAMPIKLSTGRDPRQHRAAPRLDADRAAILAGLPA